MVWQPSGTVSLIQQVMASICTTRHRKVHELFSRASLNLLSLHFKRP